MVHVSHEIYNTAAVILYINVLNIIMKTTKRLIIPDEPLVLIVMFLQADWTGCTTKSSKQEKNTCSNTQVASHVTETKF